MSIILNGTGESLRVVLAAAPASTQLALTASWADQGASSGDSAMLTTGTTAVTLVAAPAGTVSRWVGGVSIYNQDTAAATVTVQKVVSGTPYTLFKATIPAGCHAFYDNACGWRVVDASGAVVTTLSPVSSVPVGDGQNLLIDGAILVNQSAFAGGAVAAGTYGYDMWKGGTGGGNVTVNAATGVITHTSGALSQVLESPGIASQQVTISVEDPSGSVTVGIDGVTGVITAGAGRRGVTIIVPSGSTGNPVFSISATGVTYSRIKVERGAILTPWRFEKVGETLQRVQRYYTRTQQSLQGVSGTFIFFFAAPSQMRTSPSATIVNAGAQAGVTSLTVNSTTPYGAAVQVVLSGTGGYAIGVLLSLDARI